MTNILLAGILCFGLNLMGAESPHIETVLLCNLAGVSIVLLAGRAMLRRTEESQSITGR